MRVIFMLCLILASGLAAVPAARAHRVNIFAYVDGDVIRVECGFNRSRKVRQGTIEVFDATTGARVTEGRTDDAGVFVFPVPSAAREAGHALRIRILAGEGHQNEWVVSADELRASAGGTPATPAAEPPAAAASVGSLAPAGTAGERAASALTPGQAGLTPAEVERIVNTALDVKLAPIKRMLAEQFEAGPNLRDIIGGIGWIFGLIGVAAYFRRR